MCAFLLDYVQNSTIFGTLGIYWTTLNLYLSDSFQLLRNTKDKTLFDDIPEALHFDEFQFILLKTLLLFLFINLALIFVAWKVYGRQICERFMRPATSKAIEELKASVSKLKLPKEHTPRI